MFRVSGLRFRRNYEGSEKGSNKGSCTGSYKGSIRILEGLGF